MHKHLLLGFFNHVRPHLASACVAGKGARWAARLHARHPYLLHIDISHFFPSVTQDRVFGRFCEAGCREDMAWVLSKLLCLPTRLPQGAHCSNAVGDIVLYPMDARIFALSIRHGFKYTRYVDDIGISGGFVLTEMEQQVRQIIAREEWSTNDKGGLAGPDERHQLVGITVNSGLTAGRSYARKLRDDLRRAGRNPVSPSEINSLRGRVNYVLTLSPNRTGSLTRLLAAAEGVAAAINS